MTVMDLLPLHYFFTLYSLLFVDYNQSSKFYMIPGDLNVCLYLK